VNKQTALANSRYHFKVNNHKSSSNIDSKENRRNTISGLTTWTGQITL